MISFKNLKIINPIVRALSEEGYSKPTQVQSAAIPYVFRGEDVLISAPDGSGKTAAFAIPVLQMLKRNPTEHICIRVLILVPSEDMASMMEAKLKIYSKYMILSLLRIKTRIPAESQMTEFGNRIDILVATPESLLEISSKRAINFSKLEFLIVYNAEEFSAKTWANDIRMIRKLLPDGRQTLVLCSAMSGLMRNSVKNLTRNPVEIKIETTVRAVDNITQDVYFVEKRDKANLLIDLLRNNTIQQSMIFTDNKYIADELVQRLEFEGITNGFIHGNRSHKVKSTTVEDFRNGRIQFLITTDIAAKNVDIDHLINIVNYDLPNIPDSYIQRVERIRKSGGRGSLISFCTADEHNDLKNIQTLTGCIMPVKTF